MFNGFLTMLTAVVLYQLSRLSYSLGGLGRQPGNDLPDDLPLTVADLRTEIDDLPPNLYKVFKKAVSLQLRADVDLKRKKHELAKRDSNEAKVYYEKLRESVLEIKHTDLYEVSTVFRHNYDILAQTLNVLEKG